MSTLQLLRRGEQRLLGVFFPHNHIHGSGGAEEGLLLELLQSEPTDPRQSVTAALLKGWSGTAPNRLTCWGLTLMNAESQGSQHRICILTKCPCEILRGVGLTHQAQPRGRSTVLRVQTPAPGME